MNSDFEDSDEEDQVHRQGQKRERSKNEDEEETFRQSKKRQAEKEDQLNFTEEIDEKSVSESSKIELNVKMLEVKDFCGILLGLSSIPNLDLVLFQFDQDGMMIYGKPQESSVVGLSFWNKSMFQEYTCGETVKKWVMKDRLDNMRKKISKDVEFLQITEIDDANKGFKFSGYKGYKTGGPCEFSFNIYEYTCNSEAFDMSEIKYKWHISTSSHKFKDNVDFMDDKSDFISFKLKNNVMSFEGISDLGLVTNRVSHEIETSEDHIVVNNDFKCLFYKRLLKIITSTQGLHKTVTISFDPDEEGSTTPILFHYALDQNSPQSHFSVYVLPFTNN